MNQLDCSQNILIRCREKVFVVDTIICNYYWDRYGGTDIGKLSSTDHGDRVMGVLNIRMLSCRLVAAARRKKSAASQVYSELCFNLSHVVSKLGTA